VTDIAMLGLAIDTSAVTKANAALDQLASKAKTAEQATQSLADRTAASMKGVQQAAQAQQGGGTSWSDQHQKSLQALLDKIDPVQAATRRHAESIGLLNTALAAGKISTEQHSAAIASVTKMHETAIDAIKRHVAGHQSLGASMAQNRMAMMEGEHVVRSVIDSISSGQGVIRAFSMEWTRIVEALQMSGKLSFNPMSLLKNPYVMAGVATAAAVGGAGYEIYSLFQREQDRVRTAASVGAMNQASGGMSGASIADYTRFSEDLQRYSHVTASGAREVETALARLPQVGVPAFQQLAKSAQDFGVAIGQPTTKAAQMLAEALRDPAKGAEDLAAKYNMLSAAQLRVIQQLAASGRTQEAQAELMRGVAQATQGAYDRLPALQRAADDARVAWDKFQESLSHSQVFTDLDSSITSLIKNLANFGTAAVNTIDKVYGAAATKGSPSSLRIPADSLVDTIFGSGASAEQRERMNAAVRSLPPEQRKAWGFPEPPPAPTAGAAQTGLPQPGTEAFNRLMGGLFYAESRGNQIDPLTGRITTSRTGNLGIGQLGRNTAAELGVNPYDPIQNVRGSVDYATQQIRRFGNIEDALRAYNAGPGKVEKWIAAGRPSTGPDALKPETVNYPSTVLGYAAGPEGAATWERVGAYAYSGPGGSAPFQSGNARAALAMRQRLDPTDYHRWELENQLNEAQDNRDATIRELQRLPADATEAIRRATEANVASATRQAGYAQRLLENYVGPGGLAALEYQSRSRTTFIANPAQRFLAEHEERARLASRNMEPSEAGTYVASQTATARLQQAGQGFDLTTQAGRELQQQRALAGARAEGPSAVRDMEAAIRAANEAWRIGAENIRGYRDQLSAIDAAKISGQLQTMTYALRQQADAEERLAAAAKGGVTAIHQQQIANEAIQRAGTLYSPTDPRFDPARAQIEAELHRRDAASARETFDSNIAALQRSKSVTANENDILTRGGAGALQQFQLQQQIDRAAEQLRNQMHRDLTPDETKQLGIETKAAKDLAEAQQQLVTSYQSLGNAAKSVVDIIGGGLEQLMNGQTRFKDVMRSIATQLGSLAMRTLVTGPLGNAADAYVKGGADAAGNALRNSYGGLSGIFSSLFGGSGGGGLSGSADVGTAGIAGGGAIPYNFSAGGIVSYGMPMRYAASGFVASDPMTFRGANSNLTIGELGSEAVLPLRQMANGRLGVESNGAGGGITVVQNFNTPDAASFRRSHAQMAADATAMFNRAARRR
jgi:hypothetical protein